MRQKYLILFSLSGLILCCDQLVKNVVRLTVPAAETRVLIPGFVSLVLSQNNGFAFGLLQKAPPAIQNIFFVGVPAFAMILIILIFIKLQDNQIFTSVALSTILAGAIGNLIDRLQYGHVIDFLDIRIFGMKLPGFNVADTSIVVGVLLMFISTFLQDKGSPQASA